MRSKGIPQTNVPLQFKGEGTYVMRGLSLKAQSQPAQPRFEQTTFRWQLRVLGGKEANVACQLLVLFASCADQGRQLSTPDFGRAVGREDRRTRTPGLEIESLLLGSSEVDVGTLFPGHGSGCTHVDKADQAQSGE